MCSQLLTWTTIIELSLLSLGFQLISANAQSVNASEGTQVNFACQTPFNQTAVTLVIVPMLPSNTMLQDLMSSVFKLDEGGHEAGISFTATVSINETVFACLAIYTNNTNGDHTEVGPPALLLVQGKCACTGKIAHKKNVNVFQVLRLV